MGATDTERCRSTCLRCKREYVWEAPAFPKDTDVPRGGTRTQLEKFDDHFQSIRRARRTCAHCGREALETEPDKGGPAAVDDFVPGVGGFTRLLGVGFSDRGLGHGDYGVVAADGALIAEVKGFHSSGDRNVRLLPHLENACLFAAAPDLYDACRAAYEALSANQVLVSDPALSALKTTLRDALAAAVPAPPKNR